MLRNDYSGTLQDTTKDIWERLWYCSFSKNLTTSEDYYKIFGKASTGFKKQDKMCQDEVVSTMITIDTMVEYYKKGITIAVMNYDDTKLIYECIQKHLMAWRDHLKNSINMYGPPPVEDLVELDRFANAIYDKAKYLIPKDQIDSVFITQMRQSMTLSRGSMQDIFQRATPASDKPAQEIYPERQELADVFKKSTVGFGRWK